MKGIGKRIGQILRDKDLKIAVAESCTGGLIAGRITDTPGASDYFTAGFVTYSNRIKRDCLSVPEAMLIRVGAVSSEVAEAMANGARKTAGVDIGLSSTGIAGPGGGSETKPVGTVYISLASSKDVHTRKLMLHGGRKDIRRQTVEHALMLLLDYLEGRLS